MKDATYFRNRLSDVKDSVVGEVLRTPEDALTPRLGLALMCWYISQSDVIWEEYDQHETPTDEMCLLFHESQMDLYNWLESKGLTGKKP